MSREHHERVASLFIEVLDLPQPERLALLDQRCAGDPQLRAAVEALLSHDERDDAFDETALRAGLQFQTAQPDEPADILPERIGRYRIIRKIGEGGMGIVYEAEQDNPRRRVALKVLRGGAESRELVRRFRREAHLLGRLRHPGIAHVYEAGLSDDESRRPYLAMELIQGLPLTAHARLHDLSTPQRLRLMVDVCEAVQHAHEHGIVHRDLKPANILVTEADTDTQRQGGADGPTRSGSLPLFGAGSPRACPKTLDFGIARGADADLHTMTLHTHPGQLIGTLAYMSPEQVGGSAREVDARGDVYALGVILYELLADRLPHDVRHRSIPEAARLIREEEPSLLGSVHATFRGDIETIVAKALEKDPARRYASAAELAADLRRYLDDQPIQARPASTLYQLRKFARRHRVLVSAVAAVFVILSAAATVSLRYAVIASRERAEAQHRAHRANIVAANAEIANGSPIRARTLLDQASPDERGTWEWRYLDARMDSSDAVLRGHGAPVRSLSFAPDGARLVTASDDHALRIWKLNLGEDGPAPHVDDPMILRGHTGPVARVVFTSSGREFISGSVDGTMRIWDASTGEERSSLRMGGSVNDLSVAADGKRVAALVRAQRGKEEEAAGLRVKVLDLESETVRHEWSASNGLPVLSCCFSANGSELLLGILEGLVKRSLDGQVTAKLVRAHDYAPLQVAVNDCSGVIATCAADKSICLWDADAFAPIRTLQQHAGPVRCVAFSPDGGLIASGSDDQTVRLWNVQTGELMHVLLAHSAAVKAVAFAPDGRWLGSAADDGTARLWNLARIKSGASSGVLSGHRGGNYEVLFLPGSDALVSAGWGDNTLRFWNTRTGAADRIIEARIGSIERIACSPDGRIIAACGYKLTLIDVDSGAVSPLGGTGNRARSVVFSADGTRVITTATRTPRVPRGMTRSWDLASKSMVEEREFDGDVLAAPCRGDIRLAVFGADGSRIVDWNTGVEVCRFEAQNEKIERVRFSPDGARFLTASHNGTVGVWDARTGARLALLRGHAEKVYDAIFSPDGTRIASASNDNTIRIWRADTYEEILELRGHERYVFGLAFNFDGTILASASGDSTVRVWKAPEAGRGASVP